MKGWIKVGHNTWKHNKTKEIFKVVNITDRRNPYAGMWGFEIKYGGAMWDTNSFLVYSTEKRALFHAKKWLKVHPFGVEPDY